MGQCVQRRDERGRLDNRTVERDAIDAAVLGRSVPLSAREVRIVAYRLSTERKWGAKQIAAHIGRSPSQIAAIVAEQRKSRI